MSVTRVGKSKEHRRINRIGLLFQFVSFLLLLFSVGVWDYQYRAFKPSEMNYYLQLFYITVVGFFWLISPLSNKLFIIVFKSFTKLLFNVWIMAFILISSLGQLEQSIYIIYATFFVGYLEVVFEVNDCIRGYIEQLDLTKLRIKYTTNEAISIMSTPMTVIILSIIHIILAFVVKNSLANLLS